MAPKKKYACSTKKKRGRRFLRFSFCTQELILAAQLMPLDAVDKTPHVEDLRPYQGLVEPKPIESSCFYYGPELEG